jgi:hypothetical protein
MGSRKKWKESGSRSTQYRIAVMRVYSQSNQSLHVYSRLVSSTRIGIGLGTVSNLGSDMVAVTRIGIESPSSVWGEGNSRSGSWSDLTVAEQSEYRTSKKVSKQSGAVVFR